MTLSRLAKKKIDPPSHIRAKTKSNAEATRFPPIHSSAHTSIVVRLIVLLYVLLARLFLVRRARVLVLLARLLHVFLVAARHRGARSRLVREHARRAGFRAVRRSCTIARPRYCRFGVVRLFAIAWYRGGGDYSVVAVFVIRRVIICEVVGLACDIFSCFIWLFGYFSIFLFLC